MKKKTFATVFYPLDNIHLIKDPGMIPFTMQNYYGFASVIPISSKNDYSYKNTLYKDISTPVIKDSNNKLIKKILRTIWIIKNAKKINILHLYFFDKYTFLNIFLYKKMNHNGLIYVHCDSDGSRLINYNPKKTFIRSFLLHRVLLTDTIVEDVLWGVQNKECEELLKHKWPFINVRYIPNGFWWSKKSEIKKKNSTILTVSRLGTKQKGTDLLLDAFSIIANDFPNWNLELVGPIESTFNEKINSFFIKNPELKKRIKLYGPISDREELEKIYSKAKVFCFPSLWEGFALAPIEAMSRGNYLICSDIESNKQLIQNKRYGMLFKSGDVKDLISKIRYILVNEKIINQNVETIINYSYKNYTWEVVLQPVYEWIDEKLNHKNNDESVKRK